MCAGRLKARRGANIATVALANKNARVMWALLTRGEKYCAAPHPAPIEGARISIRARGNCSRTNAPLQRPNIWLQPNQSRTRLFDPQLCSRGAVHIWAQSDAGKKPVSTN